MIAIVKPFKDDIQKLSKLNLAYYSFEDMFDIWFKTSKKKKGCKLLTREIFSLKFDSLLCELKNALFVPFNSDLELKIIKENFKIIEYDS